VHLVGSLNFLSICKIDIIVPQLGHSNFALTTWGLISEREVDFASRRISLFKCSALRLSIFLFSIGKYF